MRARVKNLRQGAPSTLSKRARAILERTAKARAEIDAAIADVVLDDEPPVLGS